MVKGERDCYNSSFPQYNPFHIMNITTLAEFLHLYASLKSNTEITFTANYELRMEIIVYMLLKYRYNVADRIESSDNMWTLLEKEYIKISINTGKDDFYNDFVVTLGNPLM
jgi:hypothetical protein